MKEDGQALVELALVLPVLLVLALAMVQLSDLAVARLALEHAAAEGARIGALTNDDELVRDSVAAATAPLDSRAVLVEIEPAENEAPRSDYPRGSLLNVRVSYVVPTPLTNIGMPSFVVRTSAVRRIEWTP